MTAIAAPFPGIDGAGRGVIAKTMQRTKREHDVNRTGTNALKHFILCLLSVISLGLLTTGCQTYQHKNKVIVYWRAGDIDRAVSEATRQADNHANGKDAIIWRLEQGTTLRAAGKYEESNQAFAQAQQQIDAYAEKAKVRLGQEGVALLSNQANLAYEGRSYDGIMLNTYRALNFLAIGDVERARPELIRAYQRQAEAVEANKKRIEKTNQAADQSKDAAIIGRAESDPGFQSQIQNSMAGVGNLQAYADYVNPFTVYLDGLYFMANAAGESDLERARVSFTRVADFAPDNQYVRQDLSTVNALIHGTPLTPTTYVIFETGCAPERGQIRIDIPIIISRVSYLGAAFPTLELRGDYQPVLTAAANGVRYNTQLVGSMDGVVALDFKNELPIIITKTVASTVAKAVAAYAINAAANQSSDWAGLLVQMATAGYQFAVNIADTRQWTTLPKEFQVCHFPTPADGIIALSTPNGMVTTISLGAANSGKNELTPTAGVPALNGRGLINVVYVRSITTGTPLLVSHFILK